MANILLAGSGSDSDDRLGNGGAGGADSSGEESDSDEADDGGRVGTYVNVPEEDADEEVEESWRLRQQHYKDQLQQVS